MKKFYYQLFLIAMLLIFNSCNLDNLDFNKLSDNVDASPEIIAPLAHADVSVWDIVKSASDENDSLVKVGDNDVVKIVYTKEKIYDYKVRELLDLPTEESFNTGQKEIGNIKLKETTDEKGISIAELQDKLSGDIDNVVEGNQVLPEINYPSIDKGFDVDPLDNFKNATIESGKLTIKMSNSGLQSSKITVGGQFFDQNEQQQVIADFLIEDVLPGNPKSKVINLSNLSISNGIGFRLTKFKITPSGFTEHVDLDADLFKMDLDFSDLEISSGQVKVEKQKLEGFSGSFDFSFEDNIKAYEAAFKYGALTVHLNNNTSFTGSLKLVFPKIDGEELNDINFGTSGSGTMTLAGTTVNLTGNQTTSYNTVPYEYSVTINATTDYVYFDSKQWLQMNVQLDNLDFQSIKGDFGERSVVIDEGSFDMDTEFFDKIEGDFRLANPTMNLILTNSIGIPAAVDAHFTASNTSGSTETIDTTGLVINSRSSMTSSAVKQIVTFDKSNSNIVSFIALPPTGDINYGGNVRFNPDGAVGITNANFFNLDDSLKIDVGLDLPFEMKFENLSFQDTSKIDGSDFDMVKSAELIISATNEIPLDVKIQIFFVDTISGEHFGSTIESDLLESGSISNPTTSENTITLDEDDADNLQKANAIVFKGIINTPQNGSQTAVLYSGSMLNVNVSLRSKVDLSN